MILKVRLNSEGFYHIPCGAPKMTPLRGQRISFGFSPIPTYPSLDVQTDWELFASSSAAGIRV